MYPFRYTYTYTCGAVLVAAAADMQDKAGITGIKKARNDFSRRAFFMCYKT